MSSFNVPGIPVYFVGPYGPELYLVPYGTPFMRVAVQGYEVPPAVEEEHPAQENGPTDEEQEAGDAFVAHTEALNRAKEIVAEFGDDFDLDAQEKRVINDLKEAIAADNAEKVMEALQDWDVRAAFDEDEDRVEEELADVAHHLREDEEEQARSQFLKDKTEELYKHLREMVGFYQAQHPLFKEYQAMNAETNKKKRDANNKKYWATRTEMIRIQKEWLGVYEAFAALYTELETMDTDFYTTFNAYVKERHPEDPDRNYKALNADIARKFRFHVRRDEERKTGAHNSAAGKPAPGTEKPAPPPATLADKLSALLAKEAAGGGSWGDM